MRNKTTILGFVLLAMALVHFSSCNKDCDGTPPSVNITNYCDFIVSLEVDIIGDSLYSSHLNPGENEVFYPHETKVKIKAGKMTSLVSLSRTKNFEAKNCYHYTIDLIQNDSSTLHRLDLEFNRISN